MVADDKRAPPPPAPAQDSLTMAMIALIRTSTTIATWHQIQNGDISSRRPPPGRWR
jgi:hypothetical protein